MGTKILDATKGIQAAEREAFEILRSEVFFDLDLTCCQTHGSLGQLSRRRFETDFAYSRRTRRNSGLRKHSGGFQLHSSFDARRVRFSLLCRCYETDFSLVRTIM